MQHDSTGAHGFPVASDFDLDWDAAWWPEPPQSSARRLLAKEYAGTIDDYEFESLLQSPDAITRPASASALMADDIDLLLETSQDAWSEAVPLIGAAASASPVLAAGLQYDYDYELAFVVEAGQPVSDHEVLFFDKDEDRLREIIGFISEGLAAGEKVCLALTSVLAEAVRAALPADVVAAAERSHQLAILDAHSTLALMVHDGVLDPKAFDEHVAETVRQAHQQVGGVRVYGEMVTVLWAQGNVVAALALERQWNQLQKEFRFSLLCAYPVALVPEGSDDYAAVFGCHTDGRVLQPAAAAA